jgi:hypothetical protein
MGKKTADSVIDASLNYIVSNATQMILCDAEPADRAEAVATALATIPVTGADFTISNGDISGRKLRVGAKTSEQVDVNGNYNHTCLISGTELLKVTTATNPRALYAGDLVNLPAWDYEIEDPA